MKMPSLRLSRHCVAWTVLLLCIPLTILTFRNTPQPPSRRIMAYRILHDQKNLDRELLLAIFKKDKDSAELALESGAKPNHSLSIPWDAYGCCPSIPNDFLTKFGIQIASKEDIRIESFRWSHETATPLNIAVFNGDIEMIYLLLQNGAKVNYPANASALPVNVAASRVGEEPDRINVLRLLLKNQATFPKEIDKSEQSLLHQASSSKYGNDLLRLLLERGADPNQRDSRDEDYATPLMWAAMYNLENVDLLLSYGANPSLKDAHGETARSWAKNGNYPEESLRLLDRGRGGSKAR
jgi:ankyrin repeat protein